MTTFGEEGGSKADGGDEDEVSWKVVQNRKHTKGGLNNYGQDKSHGINNGSGVTNRGWNNRRGDNNGNYWRGKGSLMGRGYKYDGRQADLGERKGKDDGGSRFGVDKGKGSVNIVAERGTKAGGISHSTTNGMTTGAVNNDGGDTETRNLGHQDGGNKFTKPGTWREATMGIIPNKRLALNYHAPVMLEEMKFAVIDEDIYNKGNAAWNNSVMLYVVGPRPYYQHFKAYASRTWKPKGDFDIYTKDNGFYIIKFKLAEDVEKMLTGGPYFFDGRIIIIKKWSPGMSLNRDLLTSIPIWVRFTDINLNLLDVDALGRMASVLSNP